MLSKPMNLLVCFGVEQVRKRRTCSKGLQLVIDRKFLILGRKPRTEDLCPALLQASLFV
ncbi:hypothetical protein CHELA40_12724 [Chelatococcus asaccharovorans]|nr:hypothetical protein CHELA40_12724 [Chelatococcus asaccharovorans]CAH1681840.1 hypothetical protein CHELA17_62895 [Chelatococcus asaccharovorans]